MKAKLKAESHTLLGKSTWFWLRFSLHPFNHGRQPIEFSPNPFKSTKKHAIFIWLVVWNMIFIFPCIGNKISNWLSNFSEGLVNHQPVTRLHYFQFHFLLLIFIKRKITDAQLRGFNCGSSFGITEDKWLVATRAGCPPSTPPQAVHKGDKDLKQ